MIYTVQFHLSEVVAARYPNDARLITYAWRLLIQQLEKERLTATSILYQQHRIIPHPYLPNQYNCEVQFGVISYEDRSNIPNNTNQ